MNEFDLRVALQSYARSRIRSMEAILPPDGAWSERLRSWLAACDTAPWRALSLPLLETAVSDLVTLELSAQSYALMEEGLEVRDVGGTVWSRRALADLLTILARHDPRTARDLAGLARRTREERLHRIRALIVART